MKTNSLRIPMLVLLIALIAWFCYQFTGSPDAEEMAAAIPINTPCQVIRIESYADGGSIGGVLLDEQGNELPFCWDGRERITTTATPNNGLPRLAYLGAEHPADQGAAAIPLGSQQEKQFIQLLSDWVDTEVPAADQDRLYTACFDYSIPITERNRKQLELDPTEIRALKTIGLVKLLQDQRAAFGF